MTDDLGLQGILSGFLKSFLRFFLFSSAQVLHQRPAPFLILHEACLCF